MAEVLKFYEIEPVDVEALAERHRVEKGLAQLESEELAERLRVSTELAERYRVQGEPAGRFRFNKDGSKP